MNHLIEDVMWLRSWLEVAWCLPDHISHICYYQLFYNSVILVSYTVILLSWSILFSLSWKRDPSFFGGDEFFLLKTRVWGSEARGCHTLYKLCNPSGHLCDLLSGPIYANTNLDWTCQSWLINAPCCKSSCNSWLGTTGPVDCSFCYFHGEKVLSLFSGTCCRRNTCLMLSCKFTTCLASLTHKNAPSFKHAYKHIYTNVHICMYKN